MLKFKSKKKSKFPLMSIFLWLLTLLTMIWSSYYPESLDLNKLFAINPSEVSSKIEQSWWYVLRFF